MLKFRFKSAILNFALRMAIVLLLSNLAVAEVFQWEFVDPANPALGKKKSTTLAPDGAGANLTSITSLLGRNLTKAYLFQAKMPQYRVGSTILNDAYLAESNLLNLQGDGTTARGADMSRSNLETGRLEGSDLTGAIFVGANLKGATLDYAKLQDANLSGAIIQNINLSGVTTGGFTGQQLYQTASYQQGVLGSIDLSSNDLSNWNFTEQHMENAHFFGAKFANAVFSNAVVTAADFSESNLAPTQLYDTLSYKNRQLGAMQLDRTDLSGWNFSDQSMPQARITESKLAGAIFDRADLTSVTIGGVQFVVQTDVSFRGANLNKATFGTNGRWEQASFVGANLTAANLTNNAFVNSDFTDAIVRGAKLPGISSAGFTLQNLYSTKSYQTGDLTDIELLTNEATGGVFSHINLSRARLGGILDKADFRGANLTSVGLGGSLDRADFRDADLTNASLTYNPVSFIDFRGANLTGALFERTSLVNADFTGATVFGTKLSVENSPQDLTAKQLYSTASYKVGLLGPITLAGDMRGWDFRNQDVAGGRFDRGSQLAGAKWEGANLQGTLFFVNTMPATDFRFSDVRKVRFSASNLDGSNFGGSNLSEAEFSEASLISARFDRAQLPKARFVRTNLQSASFVDADLRGTDFVFSESLVGTDFTGADIIGADFSYATDDGFTIDQLRSTRSYQQRDLSGVVFEGVKFPAIDLSNFRLAGGDFNRASLAGANLRGTDLTSVSFQFADISNLNLTDAVVRRANFDNADSKGFTRQMLESTASFKNHRLDGINLSSDDMRNWDFRGQDLREARFTNSTLTGALFDLSDLRGATLPTNLSGVNMQRAIQSEGTLAVLRVDAGEVLAIGPAPKLIRPQSQNTRDPVDTSPIPPGVKITGLLAQIDGALELLLDENEWKSTLVFNSQAAVAIHGELKLVFDEFANPAAAVGRSFDLFDWPVAGPIGEFTIVTDPNYSWDLSKIYTTGIVQLTGVVPEPPAMAVFASLAAFSTLSGYRRRIRRFYTVHGLQ